MSDLKSHFQRLAGITKPSIITEASIMGTPEQNKAHMKPRSRWTARLNEDEVETVCQHCQKSLSKKEYGPLPNYLKDKAGNPLKSHGICPDCLKQHHPESYAKMYPTGHESGVESLKEDTFQNLRGKSEAGRISRAGSVNPRSTIVKALDAGEDWVFNYKSSPSTTGRRHHGHIIFPKLKAGENPNNADIKVGCDCPDYKYRIAHNNMAAGVDSGTSGNNGADPRSLKQHRGLCKHLSSLGKYLQEKIQECQGNTLHRKMQTFINENKQFEMDEARKDVYAPYPNGLMQVKDLELFQGDSFNPKKAPYPDESDPNFDCKFDPSKVKKTPSDPVYEARKDYGAPHKDEYSLEFPEGHGFNPKKAPYPKTPPVQTDLNFDTTFNPKSVLKKEKVVKEEDGDDENDPNDSAMDNTNKMRSVLDKVNKMKSNGATPQEIQTYLGSLGAIFGSRHKDIAKSHDAPTSRPRTRDDWDKPSEPVDEGTVQCAWCKSPMGDKDGFSGVSHGMCSSCRDTWKSQLTSMKPKATPTADEPYKDSQHHDEPDSAVAINETEPDFIWKKDPFAPKPEPKTKEDAPPEKSPVVRNSTQGASAAEIGGDVENQKIWKARQEKLAADHKKAQMSATDKAREYGERNTPPPMDPEKAKALLAKLKAQQQSKKPLTEGIISTNTDGFRNLKQTIL